MAIAIIAGHNERKCMKKILFILGVITMLIGSVFAVSTYRQQPNIHSQQLTIVTTLFPLYDFAKNIGGENVRVSLLLPPGVEAHSFEPKPSDIAKINSSDLFIYTGKFMEPWAQDVIQGLSNKDITIVDSSKGITLTGNDDHNDEHASSEHHEKVGHPQEKKHDPHHHHGADPHIWLDFDHDKTMIQTITTALSQKDPTNAAYYQQNANEYVTKLTALDEQYKTILSGCETNTIVYGGHYAFGYVANRYGLTYKAAQGVSPDAEPTAQDLIQLVQQIREENIKYVFYEELTSPKIAETLAHETKTTMLLLHAAHNISKEDFKQNISFLSIMEKNLDNLRVGLQCSK